MVYFLSCNFNFTRVRMIQLNCRSCGNHFQVHPLALKNGMGHTATELMRPAHQRRTGRPALGTDMKLGKQQALLFKRIDLRGLDVGITQAGIITIASIIRHDQDNVWLRQLQRLDGLRINNTSKNEGAQKTQI